jgi:hypothetical protein
VFARFETPFDGGTKHGSFMAGLSIRVCVCVAGGGMGDQPESSPSSSAPETFDQPSQRPPHAQGSSMLEKG